MQRKQYISSRPFQGRLLKKWASSVEADDLAKVRDAVRQGYMEGKTVAQIVSELQLVGGAK